MNVEPIDLAPAKAVLAAQQEAFSAFARLLCEHNRTTNLTRIDTPEDIHTRHFLDSLSALPVLDELAGRITGEFCLIDVGSGAGFPGLAIAVARPCWRIVSLEATDKKVRFQQAICRTLGLEKVEVHHGRAEALAHDRHFRERFSAALARAVAGLDVLAELTMGFVVSGGTGLFWKGPQAIEEVYGAVGAFQQMGAKPTRLLQYGLPGSDAQLFLAEVIKTGITPALYPRINFAAIRKRPLR